MISLPESIDPSFGDSITSIPIQERDQQQRRSSKQERGIWNCLGRNDMEGGKEEAHFHRGAIHLVHPPFALSGEPTLTQFGS